MRLFGSALVLCLGGLTAFVVGPGDTLGDVGRPPVGAPQSETAGVVAGSVIDGEGKPLVDVAVDLLRTGAVIRTGKTNARGEFRFEHVAPGMYEVRATGEGVVPATVRLAVNTLPTPLLRLTLWIPLPAEASDSANASHKAHAAPPVSAGIVMGPPPWPSPTAMARQPAVDSSRSRFAPHPLHEAFNTAAYDKIDDNRFRRATDEPLSTFSIDVDTASYSNVRRFLNEGTLPPPDAVRTEELINYFRFAYPDARGEAPFSVTTEVAACPWNSRHKLALIGLQARRDEQKTPPRNLVFLLDVSGSMTPPERLPLVKTALRMLVDTLTPRDRVAIVVYAGASGLALPSTPGNRKAEIHRAIADLSPGGSTNGAAGIQLAYDTAASAFIQGGVNRVILATDGDFNVGVTSQGELMRLIERQRERAIFLSVLGVGTDNLKDSTMEKLADRGNGNYAYLDSLHEARRVLIEEAGATMITVAKDVKIQIEFNPRTVGAYRLIGYENRLLNRDDFNDDTKDAGEIGAGHTVTVLYELVPPGEPVAGGTVDPLKYQDASRPAPVGRASDSSELMTVKVRYKNPDSDRSQLLSVAVREATGGPTSNIGFAAAVAQFGMLLRNSEFKGQASWSSAQTLARKHRGEDPSGYRAEFVRLLDLAAALDAQNAPSPQTIGRRER